MKRLVSFTMLIALTVAPLACEGEPPITPADLPAPPAASIEAVPDDTASAAPAPSRAPAAPVASVDPASSSAPAASSAAPPPPPARANITGTVTATPPSMSQYAVVWLEDGPADAPPSKPVSIDNRMMTFIPFVQVVPAGGKVIFTNGDPFPHNVFTPDNERFNLGNLAQHGASVRVFKQPTTYALLCNLHPGMLGYLVVTPSTWYAKAGKGGAFALKDVPSGTYKMTAWAPRQALVTQSITVGTSDATVRFELHRQ
jgi:plastocyanin